MTAPPAPPTPLSPLSPLPSPPARAARPPAPGLTARAAAPHWHTASAGHSAGTSPREQAALGLHLGACRQLRGRLFALRCVAERTQGLLAARVITSLVVLAAALVLAAQLI